MEPFEALSLCAEIAIAITGFSGVVLVFIERSGRQSGAFDRYLFRTLFTATLIPLGLISVAFVLDASTIERSVTWRTCSSIHVLAVSATVLFNLYAAASASSGDEKRQVPYFSRVWRGGAVVFLGALLVMGLQLANAISLHSFWPVLVAVWWGIALALFAFVSLLFPTRAA